MNTNIEEVCILNVEDILVNMSVKRRVEYVCCNLVWNISIERYLKKNVEHTAIKLSREIDKIDC